MVISPVAAEIADDGHEADGGGVVDEVFVSKGNFEAIGSIVGVVDGIGAWEVGANNCVAAGHDTTSIARVVEEAHVGRAVSDNIFFVRPGLVAAGGDAERDGRFRSEFRIKGHAGHTFDTLRSREARRDNVGA